MDHTPTPGSSGTRYWKISAGENASQWEDRMGFIGLGWEALGDVSGLTEEQFQARLAEESRKHDFGEQGARQVWPFARDIRPGDVILANLGTRAVLGLGRVTRPYRFVEGVAHRAGDR